MKHFNIHKLFGDDRKTGSHIDRQTANEKDDMKQNSCVIKSLADIDNKKAK